MRRLKFVLFSFVLISLWHCGLNPEEACNEMIKVQCERRIACATEAMKTRNPDRYDQAKCEASFKQVINCAATADICSNGTVFSTSKASKCVDEYKALDCRDVNASKKLPSCQTLCE